MMAAYPHRLIFSKAATTVSSVTVCVSLYNYQQHIVETLMSVYHQTQENLNLVIVEDCSTDDSLAIAENWLQAHAHGFNRVCLVQHGENSGLAAARNTAIHISNTPYVFILDADNVLYPRCMERCVEALKTDTQAAVAYPIIEKFGEMQGLIGNVVWNPDQFKRENCIDAMSLIRREALNAVEGYSEMVDMGWEDYELWCKFIDSGFYGVPVPEILARYRTHAASMLNRVSNQATNRKRLQRDMMARHPWLELSVG